MRAGHDGYQRARNCRWRTHRPPIILAAMRRILRSALAALLSLALIAGGATLGIASHMAAHERGVEHIHTDGRHTSSGVEHPDHAAHHAGMTMPDETPQPSGDHPSKSCCTACTVASPLPAIVDTSVEFTVSAAVYTNLAGFDVSLSVPVDPGIPKRNG